MEIAFSEKISPQLSAALLSTPYELGKEGQAVIVRSRVDESKTWQGTISKVDTENPQTDNSNSGMYDDGNSEQKASKYKDRKSVV